VTGLIPQDVLDRVLAAHDIVEVVGRHLPLTKAGRSFKALCPFHDEKTPSFTVNPDRQSYRCFGCGKGGNVFGFLMEKDGLTFPEAVRALAAERGIEVPRTGRRESPEETSRVERTRAALALAQDLYRRTLDSPEGEAARRYLEKRGFTREQVAAFGLGLSPARWDGLLETARLKGLPVESLADAGLVVRRESGSGWYDRFRGRLMFPVRDLQGRVVTFGARAMLPDDAPKYLNGPETVVFRKGATLFGLDRAKDAIRRVGHALLSEGYVDVLMAHAFGFEQAVAGMGTAFTPDQARLLHRFAPRVVLLYDGDQAGRVAAERSLDLLLEEGLEVRVALLPEGKDVDEVLLEEGAARLQGILDGAKDLFDFKHEALAARHDLSTVRGRALAAEALLQSARRVRSALERDLLFRRIAERLGVDEGTLRAQAAREPGPRPRREAAAPRADALSPEKDALLEQEWLVAGAAFRPLLLPAIAHALLPEEIADPGLASLYRAVLAIRAAGQPVHVEGLARRVAADAPAAAALARLPGDARLDERVSDALKALVARKAVLERRRSVVAALGAGSGERPPPN
jgi:DNA primase